MTDITATLKDVRFEPSTTLGVLIARGKIYGDNKGRFGEGTHVHTSGVLSGPGADDVIVTRNSVYQIADYRDDVAMWPVTSSNVASIGYRGRDRVLIVSFKNGSRYEYDGVPLTVFAALFGAESVGQYLNRGVKGTYPYRQVQAP